MSIEVCNAKVLGVLVWDCFESIGIHGVSNFGESFRVLVLV